MPTPEKNQGSTFTANFTERRPLKKTARFLCMGPTFGQGHPLPDIAHVVYMIRTPSISCIARL